jgi:hypothetical protein
MHDQPRQPLAALFIVGSLIGRQPDAARCVAVLDMDRPAGARSVTCCPQPGQCQRSGGK